MTITPWKQETGYWVIAGILMILTACALFFGSETVFCRTPVSESTKNGKQWEDGRQGRLWT